MRKINYFALLNVFTHTWLLGQKLSPKILLNFSLLMGNHMRPQNFIEMYVPYRQVQETYFENGFNNKKLFIKFC